MFNIFKKNEEYISCEWLEYGVHFSPRGIEHCCMYVPKTTNNAPILYIKNGRFNFDDFFKQKLKLKKQVRKGTVPDFCTGCYNLKKQLWIDKKQMDYVVVNLNYDCNSDCIYCYTHNRKRFYNSLKHISFFNDIKKLVDKKLIQPSSEFHIGGGEPLLHADFEPIMNLILDNGFNNIKLYSSGLEYSPAIERALKLDACEVFISPDSGDEKLYKKIKNTDKFFDLWQNIKKYCDAQNNNKHGVCLKYIIIPKVNDSKEAIDKFLSKVKESGAATVVCDIERTWYTHNKDDKEKMTGILALIEYIDAKAKEAGLKIIHFPAAVYAMDNYRD